MFFNTLAFGLRRFIQPGSITLNLAGASRPSRALLATPQTTSMNDGKASAAIPDLKLEVTIAIA